MSSKRSQIGQDLSKFIEAAWVELPAALAGSSRAGSENPVREAGWKAYDAWIALANEATNQLYENEGFAALSGRIMESTLRMQQVGRALSAAFFGNLWPAIGLPASSEIAALREEITELREQLAENAGRNQAAAHVKAHEDGLHLVRGQSKRAEDKEDAAA